MGTNFGGMAAANANWFRPGAGKLFILPYPNPSQEVGKVTVTVPGTTFVQGALCTFAGGGSSVIRQAQGFANVAGGIITSITITDPGAGYTTVPTCTAAGGTGATLTPALGLATGPLIWLAPPASPAFSDYQAGWLQRLYLDPTSCQTLNPLITPWGFLTADGLKVKFDQEDLKVNPNDGPEFILAAQDLLVSGEFTFLDVNIDHLVDGLSTPAGNITVIAGSAGNAGRTRIGMGSERALNKYLLIYRQPSTVYPGDFDHLVIPRATINISAEMAFSKSKAVDLKVSFSAQPETSLTSPFNGEYCTSLWDMATAPRQ
jgi:hypothetical protein